VSEIAPLDPERIVGALAAHGVRYVLIGALAGRLQGLPRFTADADITPSRDQANLAAALRELGARVYTDGVPEGLAFDCTARTLARAEMWNLVTDAGRIDVVFRPAGTEGYDDLVHDAITFEVFGAQLMVSSLADLIRSKEAADRPQDRQDVILMKEILKGVGG
jgi:hypothetical protein